MGHLPGDLPPRDDDGASHPPVSSDVVPVHHEGKLPGVLQHKSHLNGVSSTAQCFKRLASSVISFPEIRYPPTPIDTLHRSERIYKHASTFNNKSIIEEKNEEKAHQGALLLVGVEVGELLLHVRLLLLPAPPEQPRPTKINKKKKKRPGLDAIFS
ncbi:hypothetical protein CEXT_735401 [Caerostris extrusa]|uniref:Uncharacterized protein n=1 Tax=Caerostris extrusa TaxID=172846 RepID=A0AAV4T4P1_CAEEX|nr:hypothetical protein CEXT_735401 [Caerostris extrusa]